MLLALIAYSLHPTLPSACHGNAETSALVVGKRLEKGIGHHANHAPASRQAAKLSVKSFYLCWVIWWNPAIRIAGLLDQLRPFTSRNLRFLPPKAYVRHCERSLLLLSCKGERWLLNSSQTSRDSGRCGSVGMDRCHPQRVGASRISHWEPFHGEHRQRNTRHPHLHRADCR